MLCHATHLMVKLLDKQCARIGHHRIGTLQLHIVAYQCAHHQPIYRLLGCRLMKRNKLLVVERSEWQWRLPKLVMQNGVKHARNNLGVVICRTSQTGWTGQTNQTVQTGRTGLTCPTCPIDPIDPIDPIVPINPINPINPIDPISQLNYSAWSSSAYTEFLLLNSGTICFIFRTIFISSYVCEMETSSITSVFTCS